MGIQPIRIVIQGVDKFSSTIAKSQKRIDKFGKSMSRAGRSMTMALTVPLVTMGVAALKTTADFEQSMLRVGNLTGATGKQFAALESQARDLGATTLHTASQAAEGMGFLGMAGFKTNEIMSAMPATLDLATVAQIELGRSADIVSNVLTAYNKDASETVAVVDLMTDTMNSANTNMEQLAEAMKFVGPIAAGMKIPIDQTVTAIGQLSNAGIQGAMAGTQLRGVLAMLADPSNKARSALARLEIPKSAIVDTSGNIKDLGEVIRAFGESGATTADMLQIFGRRIGPGMVALVGQGHKAFAELNTDLKDSAGEARKSAEAFEKSFTGELKTLVSALQEFGISMIKDTGILASFTSKIKKVTIFVRNLAKANPQLLKMGAIFAAIVAVAGPLLVIFGTLISSVATIGGAIAGAGGMMAILLNPVTLMIAGIGVLIGMFVAMREKFGMSIKDMAVGFLAFTGPVGLFASVFINNWGKILPFIKLFGITMLGLGKILLYVMWPFFKILELIGKALSFVVGKILDLLSAITRIALPKWLEKKIGLTPGVEQAPSTPDLSADALMAGVSNVNTNKNETTLKIEDRAGVKITSETTSGTIDTEVTRGLAFP